MMTKFKVGDKVKINSEVFGIREGYVTFADEWVCYVCSEPNGKMAHHISDDNGNFHWVISNEELTLVSKRVSLQSHIDAVMDEFDFGKVHKVMQHLDWQWWAAEEGVPREAELRKQVRYLMTKAYEGAMKYGKDWGTATGGFNAQYYYEYDYFDVDFRVSSWTTEYLGEET